MIPSGVQIFLALAPVDLRCGFDRLSGLAQERMGYAARSGALFMFFGKRRTSVKILFFDGSGMCIYYKRLDRGTFVLPEAPAEGTQHVEIDDVVLEALLDGVQIGQPTERKKSKRRPIH
jgi:transposase